jgi:hypothetical protein
MLTQCLEYIGEGLLHACISSIMRRSNFEGRPYVGKIIVEQRSLRPKPTARNAVPGENLAWAIVLFPLGYLHPGKGKH